MADRLTDLVSSIMSELQNIAKTETIVGEPVKLGQKMVVPVSRLSLGFAVGGGEGEAPEKGGGFGGGGGGGAKIEPVGFIVIDEDKISFLPTKPGKFDGIIEAIPGVFEKVKEILPKKDKAVPKSSEGKEE